jgi:hypothetical protein
MTTEERLLRLENAFATLVELSQVQSERIDEKDEWGRQFNAHLNVLGERMTELAGAQVQTEKALAALIERVDTVEQAVVMLTKIVSEGRNGQS